MPDAETRQRFDHMESKMVQLQEMVWTLWEQVERQQQSLEALRKRVGSIDKSSKGDSKRR